ncbi:suppressor of fused domain protein [Clostridium botulinum]|nr:suppressor of fused domain protein [Clostridium botulinum]
MSISKEKKIIAKSAFDAFGGKPLVVKYWDDKKEHSIDILLCNDRPDDGVTSYSTIGLSSYSIGYKTDNVPLRVEIVGACASGFDCFSNILASCAFNVINTKFKCYPGAIFENVVKFYKPDYFMKHILFSSPFLWEDKLKTLNFEDKKVAWLLAIPISEEEFKYANDKGSDALEELFEEHQIDIFNLNRKSVL